MPAYAAPPDHFPRQPQPPRPWWAPPTGVDNQGRLGSVDIPGMEVRRNSVWVGAYVVSSIALLATVFTDDVSLTGPCYVVLQVAGLVVNAFAAGAAPPGRIQWAWRLLASGFVMFLASTAFFAASGLITTDNGPVHVNASWVTAGIVARCLFTVILTGALLILNYQPMPRGAQIRQALDALTVLGGGLMVTWYFILGPVASGARGAYVDLPWEQALIPVADLALVMIMSAVLVRGSSPAGRRPLRLLLAASLSWLITDFLSVYTSIHPGRTPVPAAFVDVTQIVPLVFMVIAAAEQYVLHIGRHGGMAARRLRPVTWLPYLALVGGFALQAVAADQDLTHRWPGLVAGASLMTFCVAARQFTVLRENRSLAATDMLTGLANRIRLHEVFADIDQVYLPAGRHCAVLLIDLNDFKPINDTLGHEAGDAVLIAFADILRAHVRSTDTAARLGGDEFAVVLTGIRGSAEAVQVAERILKALETPFPIAGRSVSIRASIGIATATTAATAAGGAVTCEDLLNEADQAMYEAKRERTHGWRLFTPDGADAGQRQVRQREELRQAIETDQLRVVYQPIVELSTERPIGFEALVRWQHPTRGLLNPDAFLPLAERTGLLHDVDMWVLQHACLQMGDWAAQLPTGRGLRLSANLSPGQLKRPDLSRLVLDILVQTGFDPHLLVLEITETAALAVDEALSHVMALRDRGVRIALDDFGTGHSALEHLLRMPVDVIKLDRCFVTELDDRPASIAIAQAVVRLSQVLHLNTVAEGIETSQQAQRMLELGYLLGQGYHYARPLTADMVSAYLAQPAGTINSSSAEHTFPY